MVSFYFFQNNILPLVKPNLHSINYQRNRSRFWADYISSILRLVYVIGGGNNHVGGMKFQIGDSPRNCKKGPFCQCARNESLAFLSFGL
jgi:hypothetical protein